MKIGILFPRQGAGLAACLSALLPDAEIVHVSANLADNRVQPALLTGCDHVITAAQTGSTGPRPAGVFHTLPVFRFAGFHPDIVTVPFEGMHLAGPTGTYHSRIAILTYLAGMSVPEAEGVFNPLTFARLGYLDAFAVQSRLLTERWARAQVPADALLSRWHATGCFAHGPARPKTVVMLDMARMACAIMGVQPLADVDPARLADVLADGPVHPVFPAIAHAAGVAPEGCFSPGLDRQGHRIEISLANFLEASFAAFGSVPPGVLLGATGVADGMAMLDLRLAARPAGRRPRSSAMALMTFHGSLLQHGPAPGQMVHRAIGIAGEDARPVLVDCSAPAILQEGGDLPGAVLREAGPAFVTLTKDYRYLCAERDTESAGFSRHSAVDWESFLPLAQDDVATLRRIAATDWFLCATGDRIPHTLIRSAERHSLQFGKWRVDLVSDFPFLTEDQDGAGTVLTLRLDGEVCTLVPAPAGIEAGPAPAELLAPGRRLVFDGGRAWLPPPITSGDADRAWLYDAAADPTMLNGRARPSEAALRRAADVLLGEGAPQGRLPGMSLRFCQDWQGPHGFAHAALRLHVLGAVAPSGAHALLPAALPDDFVQGFHALSLSSQKFVRLPDAPVLAADLIWLDEDDLSSLPADALAGVRARMGPRTPGGRKVFFPEALGDEVLEVLARAGFEPAASGLSPLALMGLASQAGWVAGASGNLPLLFCQPGTRVVEFCDEARFDGEDWMMSAKLGLMHGVARCRRHGGMLRADAALLDALLRVMDIRAEASSA